MRAGPGGRNVTLLCLSPNLPPPGAVVCLSVWAGVALWVCTVTALELRTFSVEVPGGLGAEPALETKHPSRAQELRVGPPGVGTGWLHVACHHG